MTPDPYIDIYYADDDPDDRFLFDNALQQLSLPYRLFEYENGAELEQGLVRGDYSCDLIFLDLNMPGKNGLETLADLQGAISAHNLKVVVFTTSGDLGLVQQTYNLNAVRYVQKPNSFAELTTTLEKIIGKRQELKLPVRYEQFKFEPEYG